jgi:hypothetical protein
MPVGVTIKTLTGSLGNVATNNGFDFQGPSQAVESSIWEATGVQLPGGAAGTNWVSIGVYQLNGLYDRVAARTNIGTSGTLGLGAQVQVLSKNTPNTPWMVAYPWSQISGMTVGIPASTSPIYALTDQTAIALPINSNLELNIDVRGWYAIEIQAQCGATTASYFCTATSTIGAKRFA